MEACVKEAYGAKTLLFGSLGSGLGVLGAKIAVTTMTVLDSQLCILSNYNGGGKRCKESSKYILHAVLVTNYCRL
jgi:hypothetical protein